MNELGNLLVADGAAAPPSHILEAVSDEAAHRRIHGAPHTIYEEVWHLAFWQQVSIDWATGIETPFPETPSNGFPSQEETFTESWSVLRDRFLAGCGYAAALAQENDRLETPIKCPSAPGKPTRTMTVREQLENAACHNAYHLGRVVLLRQLMGLWPPPSGGFTW